jgi:NAD-dependent SIR2 family protein deacetylase
MPVLTAKCVECGEKRDIQAGEVDAGDMPMCNKCGGVMIADSARA